MIRIFAHPLQRNHDVFVDLKRVRMASNRRCARTVKPKLLTRLGTDCNEAFTMARIGQTHDLTGCGSNCRVIVADNVANQNHFGQYAALTLGGIPHRTQITFVQML